MNKHFTEWMEEGRAAEWRRITARLLLADGTSLSIQASDGHYCAPRCDMNEFSEYHEFEIGFPSSHIAEIETYKDGTDEQQQSVFGYVPVEVINSLIEARGGVVGFHKPDQSAA